MQRHIPLFILDAFRSFGIQIAGRGGRAQARSRGGAAVGAVVEVGRVEEVGVVGHFAPGDDCCVLSSFRAWECLTFVWLVYDADDDGAPYSTDRGSSNCKY
eukprot:scaffold15332_cov241-Alexandrium_tamarense.AAC.8